MTPRVRAFAWAALCACGGGGTPDGGADARAPDAGARTDADLDAGPDAGPPRPRALDLVWLERVESTETLAVVADSRLARGADGELVVSVTLGGAPATFAPGIAQETSIGDATENRVTQALAWYGPDGLLRSARAVAVADPSLSGFAATGFGLATRPDGTILVAGRFLAGARFGADDPLAVVFQTVREMPARDLVVTSEEGYLARFAPSRAIEWARRARSETGFAHILLADLAVLEDGSSLVLGSYDDPVTLGEGEPAAARFAPARGTEREVMLARFGADGSLVWARRVVGHSDARRVAAFPDGSSVVLLRHAAAATFGPGEPNERTLDGPPAGVLEWDAIARFDPDGQLAWARPVRADATTYPGLRDLWLGADGSIVVAGSFRGRLEWPDETIPPVEVYGTEGLLARLDPSGALLWQRRIRPVNSLQVQAITEEADGDTWVAATVSMHGASFLPDGGEPFVLEPSRASTRLVMLRYDLDGALRAAHLAAENDVDLDDLLTLASGELAMVGRYGVDTIFEPATIAERPLPPALAFRNVFVARYAPFR